MNKLVENIKASEGFVEHVYKDSLGIDTLGYGTKMPLDKEEAELLLKHRLGKKINHLLQEKPIVLRLPQEKQEVLFDLSYQLGVNGLLKFKRMWLALESFQYEAAAVELLDSRYAKQTPKRAEAHARILGA